MSEQAERLPPACQVLAAAIRQTLCSRAWACALGDEHQRAWLLLRAASDALHGQGVRRLPSGPALDALVVRGARNRQIVAAFNGRNYGALAAQYSLSTRTVRRIIERARRRRGKINQSDDHHD